MVTGLPISVATDRLISIYKSSEYSLTDSLAKVASGKRISSPANGSADYFRAQSFNRGYSECEKIRNDVADASGMIDVGVVAGESVFKNLSKMRQMVDDYYDSNTTQDQKNAMKADFDQLIKQVNSTIANCTYDGKKLIQDTSASGPLKTVLLDDHDLSQTFSINFTAQQVADPTALTLGSTNQNSEATAVQNELDKAGSYLAAISAYSQGIKSQYRILEKKMTVSQQVVSNITDADEAAEMAKATKNSIRHQSAATMMAQANSARASILRLLNF